MLKVEDLFSSQLPREFLNCLPTSCDSCGAPTEITETLTMLRCSNPKCIEKSVQRLVAMMQDIGVKGMGDSKCRKFLENFNVLNPYIIFAYEPSEDGVLHEGCSMQVSQDIYEKLNKNRSMLLWEYVKIGNLPGIRDSARKLFGDYSSLDEFYDDLEEGGIDHIQSLLGVKGSDEVSVTAVSVYNTLLLFKDDLFEAIEYVSIIKLDVPTINICLSTSVGYPYESKKDFISKMNDEFGSKVHINYLSTVSRECQFLIWKKEGAPTLKVKTAREINDKLRKKNEENGVDVDENTIKIMTGEDFRNYLVESFGY